ncbi:MAG: PEP-CTERM sorting domain-containing protein [Opitutales bacterium]|nr:PEP-CTERM sorting domain-containing protein [Opitutales bacterium]
MNKKTIRFLTTLAAGIFFAATAAKGVVLVTFDFSGEPGNQQATFGTITGDNDNALANAVVDRGAGLTIPPAFVFGQNSIDSSGWDTLGPDDYFSLRVTVNTGFQAVGGTLNLTTVSGDLGPRNLAIRYSADNFASEIGTFVHDGGGSQVMDTYVLPFPTFEDVVEFRIFATDNTSANGQTILSEGRFRIQEASFEVIVIPEPSTYAAIVGALFLGLVLYRRRQK